MSRRALIRLDVALAVVLMAFMAAVTLGASGIFVEHELERPAERVSFDVPVSGLSCSEMAVFDSDSEVD